MAVLRHKIRSNKNRWYVISAPFAPQQKKLQRVVGVTNKKLILCPKQ